MHLTSFQSVPMHICTTAHQISSDLSLEYDPDFPRNPMVIPSKPTKCHQNPPIVSLVILLTNKETDNQTNGGET